MKIIGEKINATISSVKNIIQNRDETELIRLAAMQAEAGAAYIDVNVGTGEGTGDDEIEAMKWAVSLIKKAVEKPLCVDSADPAVIAAGLEALNGEKAMINSVKAEEKLLEAVLPLAAKHNSELIALAMDEKGIPKTVDERVTACEKVASYCSKYGLDLKKIYFDPLVLPVSADVSQGLTTLDTLRAVKNRMPEAQTVMGLSNVSYGLPSRKRLNISFLHMAVYAGLDAAIANPMDSEFMGAVKSAEVLTGRDKRCRRYMRQFRQ
jgi:5-methyltetrahydrofolate corrinoid/iron sulfur protein methyltransferase